MQETPVTPVQQLPPPGGVHTCPAGFVLLSHIAELSSDVLFRQLYVYRVDFS